MEAPLLRDVLEARTPLDERMLTLRKRSLLAHSAAGDLLFWDAQEQLLRAVSPSGGADAHARAWRPQLVSDALLRAHPSFLAESAERQQLLLADAALEAGGSVSDGMPFEVHELVLSEDGAMAALVGLSAAAVLALHLLTEGGGRRGGGARGEASPGAQPCYAVLVGDEAAVTLAAPARAGGAELRDSIVGAAWHPLSSTHLVLLRASGALSMTDVCADARAAELQLDTCAREPAARASALALGAGCGAGWASVTAYVGTEGGALYAVCPFLPRCAHAAWHVMRLAREVRAGASAAQRRWLRACARELAAGAPARAGGGGGGEEEDAAEACHALPAIQGPIAVSGGGGAGAEAPTGALLLLPSERTPHLLARARLDGSVELLLVSAPPQGAWQGEGAWGGARGQGGARLELLCMQTVRLAWPKAVLSALSGRRSQPDGGSAPGEAEGPLDCFGALSLGAPELQVLAGRRAWVSLHADAALPEQLYVRDSNGCHVVHAPWLGPFSRFLRGGQAAWAEEGMADVGETVPDCPSALGLGRALLPSEGELLAAADARADGGRRARARLAREAKQGEEEEEGGAEAPAFRLRPSTAAGARLELRPQLLGVAIGGGSGRGPSGGAAGCALGGGPMLFALCADGSVRAADLSAAPPAPPPPAAEHEPADGGAAERQAGADGGARAGGAGRNGGGDEQDGGFGAHAASAHAARLRALMRAAEAGASALAKDGGLEAVVTRASPPAASGASPSEHALAAFERAAASLKYMGALPALELGAHAQGRLDALAGGMASDALREVQALMSATQARSLLLEAKARYASAYQRNLSARSAALHAILARTCQPPLSAEERQGALEVGELLAQHHAAKPQLARLLEGAREARAPPLPGRAQPPMPVRVSGGSPPLVLLPEQLEELGGVLAQQEARIAGLMQAVAETEDRLRAAEGALLLDQAERHQS